jgi:hypothetical protein
MAIRLAIGAGRRRIILSASTLCGLQATGSYSGQKSSWRTTMAGRDFTRYDRGRTRVQLGSGFL